MADTTDLKKTPLHDRHLKAGAKMAPFGGWDMPLHYGSQVAEHHAVRQKAGLFDVSHMGQVNVRGPKAKELVQRVVMNDVEKLADGQALYSPMCNDDGGVLDDLLVTRLADDHYFIVVNAGTQEDDFAHMRNVAKRYELRDQTVLSFESELWSMVALQGPDAEKILGQLMSDGDWTSLGYFHARQTTWRGAEGLVSRTGYTGEDGFELIFPPDAGRAIWDELVELGVQPCGLGARDTLRLEAGYMLYGQDMTPANNPIEASLGWATKEAKSVPPVGARAVANARSLKEGDRRFVGLVLEEKGIPRHDTHLLASEDGASIGVVTSGTFSPTLQKGIALGYVGREWSKAGTKLWMRIRGKSLPCVVSRPPFVKDTSIKKA